MRRFYPMAAVGLHGLHPPPGEIAAILQPVAGVGKRNVCGPHGSPPERPWAAGTSALIPLDWVRTPVYLLKDMILDLCSFDPEQDLPAA